jgi:hypothetical protein
MVDNTQTLGSEIERIAQRHGISEGAAHALYDAVRRGGGGQAQFSHPDLGGMGQWSRGGMTQIGDMFNNSLKVQVSAACQDLALLAAGGGADAPERDRAHARQRQVQGADDRVFDRAPHGGSGDWWPEDLGSPASSGAQNDMRYACFPERRRLAIRRNGQVTVYDTGHYRLTSFSQQQSTTQDLVFSGPDGTVRTDSFRIV